MTPKKMPPIIFAALITTLSASSCRPRHDSQLTVNAEAEGNTESACAETIFRVKVPEAATATPPTTPSLKFMTLDSMLFSLTGFTVGVEPLVLENNSALVPCAALQSELRAELQAIAAQTTYPAAFKRLRETLAARDPQGRPLYMLARQQRHPEAPVGETLAEFEARFPFRSWPREVVTVSRVKGVTRVLYRQPAGLPEGRPEISVAQTLLGVFPDGDGPVRETEAILEREDGSGNFDFYAYGETGEFELHSVFTNSAGTPVTGPVPYTCMACHYDKERRVFQRRPLSFAGGDDDGH